ncbi:unnamed protein product [Caenorhabditis brenneri]
MNLNIIKAGLFPLLCIDNSCYDSFNLIRLVFGIPIFSIIANFKAMSLERKRSRIEDLRLAILLHIMIHMLFILIPLDVGVSNLLII